MQLVERQDPLVETTRAVEDEYLFGWDETPGIVSIWAGRDGRALVWQRVGETVTCTRQRFRPWLFAATLVCSHNNVLNHTIKC